MKKEEEINDANVAGDKSSAISRRQFIKEGVTLTGAAVGVLSTSYGIATVIPADSNPIDHDTIHASAAATATIKARAKGLSVNSGETIHITAGDLVYFDATGFISGESTPFVQLRHRFDFGDTGSSGIGSWTYPEQAPASSRLKNQWLGGGVTAHVYEDVGIFTVRHKLRDLDGVEYPSPPITVVAADPDVVYSSTVYLHFGGPPGAIPDNAETHDVQGLGWPSWNSDTRYLLKAGDNFSTAGNISILGWHRSRIQKYGAGDDPIVADIAIGYREPEKVSDVDWPTDWLITDINCGNFTTLNVTDTVTFVRGQIRSGGYVGGRLAYSYQNNSPGHVFYNNKMTAFVDTHIIDNGSGQIATVFGTGEGMIFLGTRIATPTTKSWNDKDPEHTMRLFQAYKSVIQHCRFDRPAFINAGRCCLRIQSNGAGENNEQSFSSIEQSRFNVVGRCDFHASGGVCYGNWFAPENNGPGRHQLVRDTSSFDNTFTDWPLGDEIALGGRDLGCGNITSPRTLIVNTSFKSGRIPDGLDGPYHTDLALIDPGSF